MVQCIDNGPPSQRGSPGEFDSFLEQMDAKQWAAFIETGELPPALDKLN
jgi:hypothetical protein